MPPKPEDVVSTYKMIEGDYTVLVRILEANDLSPTFAGFGPFRKKASSCDAMVEVSIDGKSRKTKVKKGQLSPVFNQFFTFKLDNQKKQQLKDQTITITAYDKRLFAFKNPVIGQYQLDLCSVYFNLNHELYRTWLTLSDPTDEREGIMGYVLVNVAVLGPNDEPVVHTVATDKKSDAPNETSLVPKKIKQFPHSVNIKLFKGEHMVPLDGMTESIDAFVQVKYSGVKIKSSVQKSRNPEWNEELNLGCMLPNQSKFINFQVYDRDILSREDNMVGCFQLNFRNVYLKKSEPIWSNLYGPPIYGKGNHADLMTLYGEAYGSHYRGRILYQIETYDERDSRTFKQELKFKFPDIPKPNSEQKSYILRIDLIEGHELPKRNKVYIQVMIGPYQLTSKEYQIQDGSINFYEQLPDKKVLFPTDVSQIPDIIFYYSDDFLQDRRHTYFRIKASDVIDQPRAPKVLKMKEDRSLGLIQDDEFSGFLYANVQLMSVNPGPRKPFTPDTNEKIDYQLRVHLFLGRNLPPGDATGTSDPFVKIRCGGQLAQSKICYQTLNPGWYETLVMDVKMFPLDKPCVVPSGMFVMVFDDDGDGKQDLIGRIWITLEPSVISYQQDLSQPPVDVYYRKPKWYNIIYDVTEEYQGQLLLSYCLIRKEDAHQVPLEDIYPRGQVTKLNFFCIGLRNIEETIDGVTPSKCSVSFKVSGDRLNAPMETDPLSVKNAGVNINRQITLQLEAPNNANFCPVMDVFMWDEQPGTAKTLLGTTTIQLAEILKNYYQRLKNPIKAGDVIEEESQEDEDQELMDRINNENLGIPTKNPQTKMEKLAETLPQIDEEEIELDLALPWELPIKRRLMEQEEYNSKINQLKQEQENLEHLVEAEEVERQVLNNIGSNNNKSEIIQSQYPKHWSEFKEGVGPQMIDSPAVNSMDRFLPNHYPTNWNQLKGIADVTRRPAGDFAYDIQDLPLQKIRIPSDAIGGQRLLSDHGEREDLIDHNILENASINEFNSNQPNQQFDIISSPIVIDEQQQSQQQLEKQSIPQSQQQQQSQNKSIKSQQSQKSLQQKAINDQQPQHLQQAHGEEDQTPLSDSNQDEQPIKEYVPIRSQRPPTDDNNDDLAQGQEENRAQFQNQDQDNQASLPKPSLVSSLPNHPNHPQFSQSIQQQFQQTPHLSEKSIKQQENSIKENPYKPPEQQSIGSHQSIREQANQRQIIQVEEPDIPEQQFKGQKQESKPPSSAKIPVNQNKTYKTKPTFKQMDPNERQKSASFIMFDSLSQVSQIKEDLRSQGPQKSIVGADVEQEIPAQNHYKKSAQGSVVEVLGEFDNKSIKLSQKALEYVDQKSVSRKSMPKSVKSVHSVKSMRFGSQPLIPYSQQMAQEGRLIESQKFEKVWNTFQVQSHQSVSAASKVSSHAISIASIGKDNMDAVPSGNEHVRKKKKNFADRLKGRFNIFGFNFKKRESNNVDEETYEDYDTDPEEDLSIIPPWLRDRPFFTDDLEDFIKPSRKFQKFLLKRGQTRGSKNQFKTEKSAELDDVCILKCIFLEERPGEDIEAKKELYQKLMKPKQYSCRLYILEGVGIQGQTESSESLDTFLRVKIAGQDHNIEKQTLRYGTINPQYYFSYEIQCEIPGSSFIRIEVVQKTTFNDEVLGYTEIDLEERYFSIMWHRYPMKPLENRNLKNDIGQSVGRLQMWIDLIERSQINANPIIKIEPPPRYEFELRTIVWETKNCVFKDELAKCNDIFARGGPASLDMQETDVHWRCRAKGSFNWRMKYKTNFPMLPEEYGTDIFKIQLWDKDVIGSNELIGETDLDLNTHRMIDKAVKRKQTVRMLRRIREKGGQITDKFWLNVFHPEFVDEEGKKIPQGQICMSFELMPKTDVEKFPNGLGRDTPNNFPPLMEPTGRLSFDIANPLKFIQEVMGPDLYSKLCRTLMGILCFALMIGFGYLLVPMIISGLIVKG